VGEHKITTTLTDRPAQEQATRPSDPTELPTRDLGPLSNGLRLRREDIYGDEDR
jgi:hypothetical protein